jgi:hypothetical protein
VEEADVGRIGYEADNQVQVVGIIRFGPVDIGWDSEGPGMRMVEPDDIQTVTPGFPNCVEMIVGIDEEPGERPIGDVARRLGALDEVARPDEQAATLQRRRLAGMLNHVVHDPRTHTRHFRWAHYRHASGSQRFDDHGDAHAASDAQCRGAEAERART